MHGEHLDPFRRRRAQAIREDPSIRGTRVCARRVRHHDAALERGMPRGYTRRVVQARATDRLTIEVNRGVRDRERETMTLGS
jgi:hypothetical protein